MLLQTGAEGGIPFVGSQYIVYSNRAGENGRILCSCGGYFLVTTI